jgi:hypothetical protein
MIRGIGPVYAKKLVKAFGERVFDVIEAEPEQLRQVDGTGESHKKIAESSCVKLCSTAAVWGLLGGQHGGLSGVFRGSGRHADNNLGCGGCRRLSFALDGKITAARGPALRPRALSCTSRPRAQSANRCSTPSALLRQLELYARNIAGLRRSF